MPIFGDSRVERTHAALLEAMESGRFPEGGRLPSEHELAAQLGVSRATIREALRGRMQHQGRITRRPGDGTYVNSVETARFVDDLDSFHGLDELGCPKGPPLRRRSRRVCFPSCRPLAERLALRHDDVLHVVSRTASVANKPAIHMVDYVPGSLISMEALRDRYRGVLRPLISQVVPGISYTTTEITGEMADTVLAERLDLAAGALVLIAEETVFTSDHEPVEFSRNSYNPARVMLRTTQRRRSSSD